jgi:hypothetical protein
MCYHGRWKTKEDKRRQKKTKEDKRRQKNEYTYGLSSPGSLMRKGGSLFDVELGHVHFDDVFVVEFQGHGFVDVGYSIDNRYECA